MPRAVTPWLTAFKAYSTLCHSQLPIQPDPSALLCLMMHLSSIAEHRKLLTNLHQLSTAQSLLEQEADKQMGRPRRLTYLGEKVVREKEYRSAMMPECTIWC